MKRIFWLLVFAVQMSNAQKLKKADRTLLSNIKTHIGYLADDKLEGRRTGTAGEKLAYEYISNEFAKEKLLPKGENQGYIQDFEVNEGKQVDSTTALWINDNLMANEKDYFPLVYSANGIGKSNTAPAIQESGAAWIWDLKEKLEENKTNPHFDLQDAINSKITEATAKGAKALIITNSSSIADELKFEPKGKIETASIPVIYIRNESRLKYLNNITNTVTLKWNIAISDKRRTGHNVAGYIDNGAAYTIILGAHYDHLGYGEDRNSLYTGTTPMIHNGADDNASGTAALIEMARLLKHKSFKNYNYLFVAFSGEELGLFGSKYYTEHPTIDLNTANYMINMDMVGRLNDSTHGLTIGGYGTSDTWGKLMTEKDSYFKIKFDSTGSGPSDHTSFYRKNMPVLFFFTGVHSDYHKPSDDADKINYTGELQVIKYIYRLIGSTNETGKLNFLKTREAQASGKNTFKVSLGIMPDYTYSGGGVRVDGVSEGKLAQRVGIKAGDILIQLGDHKFTDVQSYMQVLGKFNKGDASKVKLKRGNDELIFDIVF